MIFPLNKKKKYGRKMAWLGSFIAFFLVLAVWNPPIGHFAARPIMYAAAPFFRLNTAIGDWLAEGAFIFKTKHSLRSENLKFKESIAKLKARMLSCGIKEKENKELKSLLSSADGEKFSVAAVLARSPQSPYDILVVDAGLNKGIEPGMRALAYGNVLIGYVSDVFPKTSKIKLISFPGEESNVSLVDSGISAIAVGLGGENLEITLPRAIKIKVGERVAALGSESLAAGIVEKVLIDPADPFQKILFRLPLNIQELKYIMINL